MNFIVSILVKPTIILSFAFLLCKLWRRAAASTRHAIWALALIGALILPMAELLLPEFDLPVITATQSTTSTMPLMPVSSSIKQTGKNEFQGAPPVESRESARSSSPRRYLTVTEILGLAWFLGFTVVLVRLLLGVRAARRLTLNFAVPDEEWSCLLVDLRSRLSVKQAVRIAIGNGSLSPVTWGIRKSVIVLPAQSATWSSDMRRFVLTHELGHVKRRDGLVQIVTQGVCAIHWFNPLFWHAARRLRVEREHACDDYVLGLGGKPSDYATNLIQIARGALLDRRLSVVAAGMAECSHLETRLRAIMDAGRNRKALPRWSQVSLFGFVGLLTGAIAVVQLTALPAILPSPLFAQASPIEILKQPDVSRKVENQPRRQENTAVSVEPIQRLVVAFQPTPASVSTEAAMTLEQVLAKLDGFNRTLHSMQATFEETTVTALVNDRAKSTGEFYYKRGNPSILFNIGTPAPRIILIDAGPPNYIAKVTMYNPILKEVIQFPAGHGAALSFSIVGNKDQAESQLLMGFGGFGVSSVEMKKVYDVNWAGEAVIYGNDTAMLDLKPKTSSIFASIRLWIDEQTGRPIQFQLNQLSGDYTILKFNNPRYDDIPDSKFDLKSITGGNF